MYGTISYAGVAFSGDPFNAVVDRLAAESIESNDYRLTAVSRLVLEVLTAHTAIRARVTRLAVEVIGDAFGGLIALEVVESRIVAEVIAGVNAFASMHPSVGRFALEVIGSASLAVDGLLFSAVTPAELTFAAVLDAGNWSSGGQFALQTGTLAAIRVYGDNSTTTVRLAAGASFAQVSFSTPAGPYVLSVRSGSTPAGASIRLNGAVQTLSSSGASWPAFSADRINDFAPDTHRTAGQIAELMLWSRSLTAPELAYIESYLTCRWITPSCDVYSDLGPPP